MTVGGSGRSAAGRWTDLGPRIGSSAALVVAGVAAIWLGGAWFAAFVAAIVGVIVWELSVMAAADRPVLLAVVAAACTLGTSVLPAGLGLPLALLPVLVGIGRVHRVRVAHALFTALLVLAGYGLVELRDAGSPTWIVWLVLVVAATDIAGYFVGKKIGGPLFWRQVSPKKTWSGIIGGWVAALLVAVAAMALGHGGPELLGIAVALSMASQFGDIAESALKRHVGVKDSSRLLPGHGGFFDRFDGVLGAAVLLLIAGPLAGFPPVGAT